MSIEITGFNWVPDSGATSTRCFKYEAAGVAIVVEIGIAAFRP